MQKFELSCYIQKEAITNLQFSKTEVLKNKTAKQMRKTALNRALQLGNLLKNKVNICFKDVEDHSQKQGCFYRLIVNEGYGGT